MPEERDAPSDSSEPAVSPAKRWGVMGLTPVVLLFSLKVLDEMNVTAFAVLTPSIKKDFGLSISGVTGFLSLASAAMLVGALYVGRLADRFSRLRIALIGAALCGVFSLLTGFATGLLTLGIARTGAGVAKTVNDPTHRSLMSDYYSPEVRPRAFSLYLSASTAAGVAVPLLAGGLGYLAGWRIVFVVMAVPVAVCVLIAARKLREPVRGRFERLAAGGDGDVVDLEVPAPTLREAWRQMRAIPSLRALLHSLPFVTMSFAGLLLLFSIEYNGRYGFNEAQLGLLFSAISLVNIVGLLVVGRWVGEDPTRMYRAIVAVTPALALGYIGMGLAPTMLTNLLALSFVMLCIAPFLIGPVIIVSLVTPPELRASGFAIASIYEVPGIVLLVGVGAVADVAGFAAAFASMVVPLCAGAWLFARGRTHVTADVVSMQQGALSRSLALQGSDTDC